MGLGVMARTWAVIVGLALVPGVATAIPLEPSAVTELSAPVRAIVGSTMVLVAGAAFLKARNSLMHRSVDASLESVPRSLFYGLAVHFVLLFAGAYIISQIARLMAGVESIVLGLTGIGLLTAAGMGFTVVGIAITEITGDRRPWLGLGIGTALAAGALLILPFNWGVGAWVLIVSAGIGGPAREWFHASHSDVDRKNPET